LKKAFVLLFFFGLNGFFYCQETIKESLAINQKDLLYIGERYLENIFISPDSAIFLGGDELVACIPGYGAKIKECPKGSRAQVLALAKNKAWALVGSKIFLFNGNEWLLRAEIKTAQKIFISGGRVYILADVGLYQLFSQKIKKISCKREDMILSRERTAAKKNFWQERKRFFSLEKRGKVFFLACYY
jgi:hypothetical protein